MLEIIRDEILENLNTEEPLTYGENEVSHEIHVNIRRRQVCITPEDIPSRFAGGI